MNNSINSVKSLTIGNRIPKEYFVIKGYGESNISVHAGSYHLALKMAGIENFNIINYSSVLPSIAIQVNKPNHIPHGSVMESILSVSNGVKGERLSSGIIYGWLYKRKSKNKYGGLVCEQNGDYSLKNMDKVLSDSLNEIYTSSFQKQYELKDIRIISNTFKVQKKYGTILTGLCFINYIYPIIKTTN